MLIVSKQNNNVVTREKFHGSLEMLGINDMGACYVLFRFCGEGVVVLTIPALPGRTSDVEMLKRIWVLLECEGEERLNFKVAHTYMLYLC